MSKRMISLLLAAVLAFGLIAVCPVMAKAESNLTASEDCIALLKRFEGFCSTPMWDYSQWSVGYGTACKTEEDRLRYEQEGISEEEADQLLRENLVKIEKRLNGFADVNGITLSQNRFDALVLFTYNVGSDWMFNSSYQFPTAVINGLTGNDFLAIFSTWCIAGGSVQTNLINRRLKEANIYLNGEYSFSVPANYKYVRFNGAGGTVSSRVQAYDTNTPAQIQATATFTGYVFQGWFTEASGGTKVTVLDESVAGKTLYAQWGSQAPDPEEPETAAPEVKPTEETTAPTTAPTTEPSTAPTEPAPTEPEKPSALEVTVLTDDVNVRSGAGTNHSIVTTVSYGRKLQITETAEANSMLWGKSEIGWICLKYTNYDSVASGAGDSESVAEAVMGTVTASELRIRSNAGTSYAILGVLNAGDQVKIMEQKTVNGMVWGRIAQGWISMDYVSVNSESDEKPESKPDPEPETKPEEKPETESDEPAPADPPAASVRTGTVNASSLCVRSGAGTDNAVIGYLSYGARVSVTEEKTAGGLNWGKTSGGWICIDYVTFDSDESEKPAEKPEEKPEEEKPAEQPEEEKPSTEKATCVVTANCLCVRSGAGTGNTVVKYLYYGDEVEILEQTGVGGVTWGRIAQGWICMDYVRAVSTQSTAVIATGHVNASSLCIRSGAGTGNSVIGYYWNGDYVEILEQTTVDGTPWGRTEKGWVCMTYVK